MIGKSIKLLVATVSVSQFSSVFGAGNNAKQERKELQRSLRRNHVKGTQRNMQVFEDNMYDDIFSLPEEAQTNGIASKGDDFFEHTSTGMTYDWGDSGVHEENHGIEEVVVENVVVEEQTPPPKSVKSSKMDLRVSTKVEKVSKLGKALGEKSHSSPPPKTSKTLKSKKDKGLKAGKTMKAGPPPVTPSAAHTGGRAEDHVETAPEQSQPAQTRNQNNMFGFAAAGSSGYAGYFHTTTDVKQRNDPVGRADVPAGPSSRSHHQEEAAPKKMQGRAGFTDDYFTQTEQVVFLPRPTVAIAGNVFSVNPQTMVAPIVPDGSGNTLSIGTEYLFNEVTTDATNIYSQRVPVEVDNELVYFNIALDGYCDRIGPPDQNSVQGYCFFTYTLIDPQTQLTSGSFAAQGIIVNAVVPGQLTIVGGTGITTGAAGLVEVLPAEVDGTTNPPLLVQPPVNADPFNGITGWAHFFDFDVDVLFFLPELYE
mmetsp:Transcript_3540/g.8071  ORF Transcript_3540/g.8071 Transcript_3540/m.8071 type:complete len:480 (-) Transcript_3540:89-1528(-)